MTQGERASAGEALRAHWARGNPRGGSRRLDPGDLRQQAFLRAAAVLWQFELDALQPDNDEPAVAGEVASLVLPFAVRLRGTGRDRFTLRDALRPALLRGADPAALARLRVRNAATDSREQQLVDRWLAGPDPELAGYDFEALAVVSRIRTWFDPVPPYFPSIERLAQQRALVRIREPLYALAGKSVHGRTRELRALHQFVAGAPRPGGPAILVVHGIGGVGKSSLIARFLLGVVASGDPAHLVVYLDFDHPTLDAGNGVTLMFEIVRQCATQLPDQARLQDLDQRASRATVDLFAGPGRTPGRALAVRALMADLADACGRALEAAGVSKVTLVLDTFEERASGDPDHRRHLAGDLAGQLDVLHASLPGLHTIVISRTALVLPGAEQLEMRQLEEAEAPPPESGSSVASAEPLTPRSSPT